MFRKYEKTYRIETDDFPAKGKAVLPDKDEQRLFRGEVIVSEKIDGASTAIRKENGRVYLQKRGSDLDMSHYQYKYFVRWAYDHTEKLIKLPDNIIIYGELMICTHAIYYDQLPDYFIVFDIFDLINKEYLNFEDVIKSCDDVGLSTIPIVYTGTIKKKGIKKIMPEKSAFGKIAEGIVIKNYKEQLRGKVVKPQFIKEIDESDHWRDKKVQLNKLKDGLE